MRQKIILVGLNEINFEFVQQYVALGHLPTFKHLFETYSVIQTTSESEYHLLEPWIQWVSVHTGKMYGDHQVYRLGDIEERRDLKQIWEIAEEKGLKVGAVSPFNASNRLKNPLFFVPDPWTQTTASGPAALVKMSKAVADAVNNNASQKLTLGSAAALVNGMLQYVPVSQYASYIKMAARITKKATKVCILDSVLTDTFLTMWKRSEPDFSSLFLNGGAHIQHHYMFNSKAYEGTLKNPDWYINSDEDPLLDILKVYDNALARILKLNCRLFIATGLHQSPHTHNTYYWRLKEHQRFIDLLGVSGVEKVVPRMSRDFLIEFDSENAAFSVQSKLESITSTKDQKPIFTVDNRGKSLFIELTYDNNITKGFKLSVGDEAMNIDFFDFVAFVAIKNGEHNGIGYLVDTAKKENGAKSNILIKDVFFDIVNAFEPAV